MGIYIEWFHISEKVPPVGQRILLANNDTDHMGQFVGKSVEDGSPMFVDTARFRLWSMNCWALLPGVPNQHQGALGSSDAKSTAPKAV